MPATWVCPPYIGFRLRLNPVIQDFCLNEFRVCIAGKESQVVDIDKQFDSVYEHLIRQALDVLLHVEGSATKEGPKQEMVVRLMGGGEDAWPLSVTNDLDLATLFAGTRDSPAKK